MPNPLSLCSATMWLGKPFLASPVTGSRRRRFVAAFYSDPLTAWSRLRGPMMRRVSEAVVLRRQERFFFFLKWPVVMRRVRETIIVPA
jgi:hypothetical protein